MKADSSASGDDQQTDRFEQLVEAARGGCADAIGQLIQDCRAYLLSIANQELESGLGAKVGASDIVQETMLSAHRCIADFHGHSRKELLAWLRGILVNDIKETRRRFRAAQRDVGRERALTGESAAGPAEQMRDSDATPSSNAIAHEETDRLQQAVNRLSAEDRAFIEMRNWQRLSFAEIGRRTGRTADAARKSWSRAVVRLQAEVENPGD